MIQTMLLAGDVNLQARTDPAAAFVHVQDLLDRADVRFVNLEGALAGSAPDGVDIAHKPGWRHSEPRMISGLTAAGIDGVSCANNVTYPASAMLASLAVLDQAGIGHCGAGADDTAAHLPLIIERDGTTFGFLAYTSIAFPYQHEAGANSPGVAAIRATTSYLPDPRVGEVPGRPPTVLTTAYPEQLKSMIADVSDLRQRCDVLVVSCHWGIANQPPCHYQREIGFAAIDAGADLVMGHGPHSLGGVEIHAGRPIFYSLGNFVFDWDRMAGRHLDGMLLECAIRNRQLHSITLHVTRRDRNNDATILSGDDCHEAFRKITAQSVNLSGTLTEGVLVERRANNT
jgi:poly-gamma-glutamate synthesis protein (capsule biosynthesis protein)